MRKRPASYQREVEAPHPMASFDNPGFGESGPRFDGTEVLPTVFSNVDPQDMTGASNPVYNEFFMKHPSKEKASTEGSKPKLEFDLSGDEKVERLPATEPVKSKSVGVPEKTDLPAEEPRYASVKEGPQEEPRYASVKEGPREEPRYSFVKESPPKEEPQYSSMEEGPPKEEARYASLEKNHYASLEKNHYASLEESPPTEEPRYASLEKNDYVSTEESPAAEEPRSSFVEESGPAVETDSPAEQPHYISLEESTRVRPGEDTWMWASWQWMTNKSLMTPLP